jgi:hypothetical protein
MHLHVKRFRLLGVGIAFFVQAAGKVVGFAELPGVLAPCTRMPGGSA